ncbi:hypothetical protein Y032_0556g3381 [Ancylostoma ceylanicum]|uniref:Glutaredoxin domain-containing protein n=1 Tax=Ancylostoma ceylanicum TaxID=53326 RepID=A0A016WR88_9BILA|nr:hypothetical protein Y032_0556g3381 [Ancylostoma ceylanicum]
MVRKHPVVMYTKEYCPYCVRAKNELQADRVPYVEKNLSDYGLNAEATVKGLVELTQCRTVPQIFVCGKFIGGYTELHARRKDLMSLIEQCSSDGKNIDRPRPDSPKSRI